MYMVFKVKLFASGVRHKKHQVEELNVNALTFVFKDYTATIWDKIWGSKQSTTIPYVNVNHP